MPAIIFRNSPYVVRFGRRPISDLSKSSHGGDEPWQIKAVPIRARKAVAARTATTHAKDDTKQGGTHEQHVKGGQQSQKNDR